MDLLNKNDFNTAPMLNTNKLADVSLMICVTSVQQPEPK